MNTVFDRVRVLRDEPRARMWAGVAAVALVAGVGGMLIGRSSVPAGDPSATPAEAEPATGPAGFIAMTADQLAANGIVVQQIEAGSLASEVIAQATVEAPPEGQGLLTARADGAVVRVFKQLGDPVGPGETVALLESREASGFVADRNAAAARAQETRAAAAREQRLFNAKITARQDLEAAIAAQRVAEADLQRAEAAVTAAGVVGGGRYLAVRSPIGGRIMQVTTQLGAFVSAGAQLFRVADPRRIQVEASVTPADARRISPGDRAFVELANGESVDAVVRSSTPALNEESRTATVVLRVAGAVAGLTQGQAVRARILPGDGAATGIVLPEEAIQQVEGKDSVFVAVKGGFRAVPVVTGERSGGRVEIVSGLGPGQRVAITNAFLLKADLAKGAGEEE